MTKTIFLVASLVLAVVCGSASFASGQQPAAQYAPPVAILDLPFLLRNHTRFKQAEDQMKAEIQQAEVGLQQERKGLEELAKRLQEFKPGTPDYKQIEEELARKEADLALRVNQMKRDFAEKRGKALFEVYHEVTNAVRWHAEQHGILVVLNFNGDPVDANNPQSILQGLNSPVLYKNPAVDITPVILELVNRGGVPAPPQAAVPGVPQR